jgi:hypothetical protein
LICTGLLSGTGGSFLNCNIRKWLVGVVLVCRLRCSIQKNI